MDTTSRDAGRETILRTFLIADVRGYTKFTREHGDAVAARLAKKFADLARDAVEARGGRVIELRGDEALAVFENTAQAVRAALDFQLTCVEETAADAILPLPVGIGIDAGEAVPVEDGFRGVALNMAARLCSNATAGQVIVTRNVATMVADASDLTFEGRGTVSLKGFEQPQELVEAVPLGVGPRDLSESVREQTLPIELDTTTPLIGREHEMHWLRGTWRQARRGNGRLMFVVGGAQMGKTRLAAEIATEVAASGEDVRYVGTGGAGPALAVGAVAEAARASAPRLLVVNDIEALGDDASRALVDHVAQIERAPAMVVVLVRDPAGLAALAPALVAANSRGDGVVTLGALDVAGITEIVRLYAGDDVVDAPLESIARSSGGVPGKAHEVASEWARDEAGRRLAAAAEWISEGRTRRGAGLDFANNVINLRLGRMYETQVQTVGEETECPYKGLAPFAEEDASQFFGRERLVGELAARSVGIGMLGVLGASGSGKSSVVRAGLVPSLRAGLLPGSNRWRPIVMRPGDHPSAALRDSLSGEFGPEIETLAQAADRADADGRILLIIDQFEEVFTTTEDETERAAFISDLVDATAQHPDRLIVVPVMRDDFYGRCAPYEQLARALTANHVLVAPMDREELRRAIELPARRARLHVESSLVDALIEESVDEPGSLPLLSTAMAELWAARTDGWIRMDAYEQTGGLRGAIARLAEESFGRLSTTEQDAARAMLLRLTGAGDGDAVTRRRASLDEFDLGRNPAMQAVLDRFTQDRLLTVSEGNVEVAHEALLREWPRLRDWLAEDVQGRQLRQHITESAKQWDVSGRETGELYRGARLSTVLDWTTLHGRELNELEQEFVTAGRQESEREIEKQRRSNRRLRGLLSGVAVFLVLALVAGALALVQRSDARKNATAETAQRLGAQALVQNDLDLSLLLAREGANVSDTTATRGYLLAALLRSPAALGVLRPLPGRELSVWVIDGGKRLLVANNAGDAGVVDLATRKLLAQVHDVSALVPSADGSRVAVGGSTPEVHILDTDLKTVRSEGSLPPNAFNQGDDSPPALSPDMRSAAFVVRAQGAPAADMQLVDLAKGPRGTYHLPPGPVGILSFSADGKYILTGVTQGLAGVTQGGTGGPLDVVSLIQMWRVGDYGGPVQTFRVVGHGIAFPTLSDDDRLLGIGAQDGSVIVYDVASGKGRVFNGRHNANVDQVVFSPDRRTAVSVGDDNLVLVWDVASGNLIETLKGHNGRIPQANFSLDGTTVYTASLDGSIMMWDLSGLHRLGNRYRVDPGGSDFIQRMMALSPDGHVLAFPALDGDFGQVILRDATSLKQLRSIKLGGQPLTLAFSPDSKSLAIETHGNPNGPCSGYGLAVYDVATGAKTISLTGPQLPKVYNELDSCGDFETLAWSPDGTTLAGGYDQTTKSRGTVWFWHMPDGTQAFPPIEVPKDPANQGNPGVLGVAYSPNGSRLAVAYGAKTTLYRIGSGTPLFTVGVDQTGGRSKALAFTPDDTLLATGGGNGVVRLWNTSTGTLFGRSVLANACFIETLQFSRDGRELLAAGCDGSARLIDVASQSQIGSPLQGPGDVHNGAAFAPDDSYVDVTYTDGTMLRWDIRPSDWRARACAVAGRNLTRDEWARFLPERPYGTVCPGLS